MRVYDCPFETNYFLEREGGGEVRLGAVAVGVLKVWNSFLLHNRSVGFWGPPHWKKINDFKTFQAITAKLNDFS